ncbi:hypothetical protein J4455_02705 [Candidatus Woesearchaeota archaeon]|nr:hypothetical protein [Candidatus Woesearchaeota archaeon]
MKVTTLVGLALIVASCSSREIPKFNPSSPTHEEQQLTSCFADSSDTLKLLLAKKLLTQIAQYEIKYDYEIRLKDLSECEEELLAILIRYKAGESQFNYFSYYDREEEAWNYLKKEARNTIIYNATSTD